MNLRERAQMSNGFHHASRRLLPGEHIPGRPSLIDQILACHFRVDEPVDDIGTDDASWQEEDADDYELAA